MFSWCLNFPTNRLWILCADNQVQQWVKAGLCYKFPSGPSPDCDAGTVKCTSEIPSRLLLAHSTTPPGRTLAHRPSPAAWLSRSLGGPPVWTLAWCAMPPSSRTCESDTCIPFSTPGYRVSPAPHQTEHQKPHVKITELFLTTHLYISRFFSVFYPRVPFYCLPGHA